MFLSQLYVHVVHFLLGPYNTHIHEPGSAEKKKLLHLKGGGFDLEIFYEINTYTKVYKRWWVPNSRDHVIKLSTELRGDAPEKLQRVCSQYLHLPYDGKADQPSAMALYNASNFYLDFLAMRGLND